MATTTTVEDAHDGRLLLRLLQLLYDGVRYNTCSAVLYNGGGQVVVVVVADVFWWNQ